MNKKEKENLRKRKYRATIAGKLYLKRYRMSDSCKMVNKKFRDKVRKLMPWYNSFHHAKTRCENKKCSPYPRYGGRGIKFMLTIKEIKKLWIRDKAYLQNSPTIDRKNNDGNYEYSNCRFIERIENARKGAK